MSRLSEITDLFARLALHLQTPSRTISDEESVHQSISDLNHSLNHEEDARSVRVLDTALSLMCFKAPQVFDSMVEYVVKTIVSVLSSSINCQVWNIQKKEVLLIGSSITRADYFKLLEACGEMLVKLDGSGICLSNLLYAVVRGAVSACCFKYSLSAVPVLDVKSFDGMQTAVSRVLHHLPEAVFLENQGLPLRLLAWYLDPLILKRDVLKIMQDVKERPFLHLSEEFRQRMDWCCIMKCLVLSPIMFIETTTLLHNWFLSTGLASVLQLRIHLVSVVLDVLSRPTWWGISMDVGSKLPFSHTYIPYNFHLLRILAGPLSCEGFSQMIDLTGKPVTLSKRHLDAVLKQAALEVAAIDHKSMWAMAIAFPHWFLLATALLFPNKTCHDHDHPQCTLWTARTEQSPHVGSFPSAAAAATRYIAWILCPKNRTRRDIVVDCLTKISGSWTEQFSFDNLNKDAEGYRKKLKRLKVYEREKSALLKESDCQKLGLWLEEFEDIFAKSSSFCFQKSVLFRRITLGILCGCPNHLNEDGCELLLKYAATGKIILARECPSAGQKFRNSEESDRDEAVAGARVVFSLTDEVVIMSDSLFDTDKHARDFVCLVKGRSSKYLLKCIKIILCHAKRDREGDIRMLTDLRSRLLRWKHQVTDSFMHSKDLNDMITALK
ncbi:hypothetical protein Nepgr_005915 [Nepenthes gracilis]|uniref:Uncharacterized protein n=1 Tax=Nepenthes gracilis TaxID=150966 RepID=A0AAD3S479_NEPGR|nr:hypothetical protein Nepgr_005915 [Nepenthes gracilis]